MRRMQVENERRRRDGDVRKRVQRSARGNALEEERSAEERRGEQRRAEHINGAA